MSAHQTGRETLFNAPAARVVPGRLERSILGVLTTQAVVDHFLS
jgi:hypothetical protein